MTSGVDKQSEKCVTQLVETAAHRGAKIPGVRTVLVVMSSLGMPYDIAALRYQILLSYTDSTIFFMNTDGSSFDSSIPHHVDLLIDFTGKGERQKMFFAKGLRRMARFAVGRDVGFFRKRLYDRCFSDTRILDERAAQRAVLELAGVSFQVHGGALNDQSRILALTSPLVK